MEIEKRPAKMRKLEHAGKQEAYPNHEAAFTNYIKDEICAGNQNDVSSKEMIIEHDDNEETGEAVPKISRNQLKKQLRHDRWEAGREDRKEKRKQKIKEKKERKREAWRQDHTDENGNVAKMLSTKPPRHSAGNGTQVPVTVIFDCDFEDLMYDHELKSLGLQITRCYSDNRKAKFRTHLALGSFGGKLKERFDGVLAQQYTSWTGFRFFDEDFVAVAEKSKGWMASVEGGEIAGALEQSQTITQGDDGEHVDEAAKDGEIVYLSSESDNVLTHLKPNGTYIIGGLVDKNRHKGICHKRAVSRGIQTAKLPIDEFLEMKSRQVLVINHVLEIMLRWMEIGDWGKAFMEVLPKRKGGKLKGDGEGGDDDDEEEISTRVSHSKVLWVAQQGGGEDGLSKNASGPSPASHSEQITKDIS